MQFYIYQGVNGEHADTGEKQSRFESREQAYAIQKKSAAFHRTLKEDASFFVVDVSDEDITVGVICTEPLPLEKYLAAYLNAVGLTVHGAEPEEVTFGTLSNMLRTADRADYVRDDDEILEHFGIDELRSHRVDCEDCNDGLIEPRPREQVYTAMEKAFLDGMLKSELDRIYVGKKMTRFVGHPVHYLIRTDDDETRKSSYLLLLKALYDRGRLQNRRYSIIDLRPSNDISQDFYDSLYRSNAGGAVIVRFRAERSEETGYANAGAELIERLCETAKKNRNQVLTVFCLPRSCDRVKDTFCENLGAVSLVDLREENLSGEQAVCWLKALARHEGLRTDKKLLSTIEPELVYSASELHGLFDRWHDDKLKTVIYPQYRQMQTAKTETVQAAPKGKAIDELTEMIGLTEAKRTIQKALDFHKAQKLFAEQGIQAKRPAMHMIFTGNPGTAKTTVARLFARIMKENGLLSKGQIVEVGRGDLVGKYVGWTAPTIQKKFKQAQGGVLFIDEAYSLVDDRSGSFGDEAINTIVQEMENHRDDVVVIFAGYPDKMEGFLNKNPGLRSRIAFHVKFEDYNADELCEIAKLLAKQKSLRLTEDASSRLHNVFERAKAAPDFGNGRYVRNVLEQAQMAQASRLISGDVDSLGKAELSTICAEDIPLPPAVKQAKRAIGFC